MARNSSGLPNSKTLGPVLLAILLLSLQLGGTACYATDLVWQSESRTPQQMPIDIANLYRSLYRAGNLPTQSYTDDEGKSIEAILREKNLLIGPFFPATLNQVMCDLNPTVCKNFRWTTKAHDTLVLPNVQFRRYFVPEPYDKKRGDSIESIVKDRQGCESIDESCLRVIQNLNPRYPNVLKREFEGTILVPTLAIATTVPQARKAAHQSNPFTQLLMGLNVVPKIDIHLKSCSDPPAAPLDNYKQDQERLFSQINRVTVPSTFAVTVAIFDTSVDNKHCGFLSRLGLLFEAHPNPLQIDTREPCETFLLDPTASVDHGTHVAGIIGARTTGKGPEGINPRAILEAYAEDRGANSYADKIANDIDDALSYHTARVLNFSYGYFLIDASHDPIEDRFKIIRNNVLVVAAANDNMASMPNRACAMRPACLSYPNVMSVAALDSCKVHPGMWTDSDNKHGSDRGMGLDIGAPGEQICSTVTRDRFGPLSGTSQSAAVVSGAASLFFAKNPTLTPWLVKSRLIYASDLFDWLSDDIRGGRINVENALNYEQDRVAFSDGQCWEGKAVKDQDLWYLPLGSPFSARKSIPVGRVLRVYRSPSSENYTLFVSPDQEGDDLEKITNVTLLRQKFKLVLYGSRCGKSKAASPIESPPESWTDVNDYVASLNTLMHY